MADIDELNSLNTGRRRVTRQSARRVSTIEDSSNPYKKPVYHLGSTSSSNESSNDSVSSAKRGNGRGRQSNDIEKTPVVTPSKRGGRKGGRGAGSTTPVSSRCATPKTPAPSRGGSSAGKGSTGRKRGGRRPECISSGRTPKSGRGRKKSRRSYYNSSDYHYGSDFDEDEDDYYEEEDPGVEDDDDEDELMDDDAQDDDFEMELDQQDEEETVAIPDELKVPPPPLYIEVEPTVNLVLPKSSEDLLIDKDLIIKAVGIYEPLRRFSNLVRLTQFRFEDFCAALAATDDQSSLLVELHIQLLKSLLREDDVTSTTYGPAEVKDSIQSILYFIDHATWAEILRHYLNSDPQWSSAFDLIKSIDYPFCAVETRLDVLTFLTNQFLTTTAVRDALASEVIRHEDHCRSCVKLGELICCESCPAVYHLECIEPPLKKNPETGQGEVPDEWQCCICKRDELTGTADCISELERAGLLIRQEKLGYDRHGRKYWFLARRIIVEGENECWYYTTKPQLVELMYCLEGESYEENLLNGLRYHQDEIERQMEITEEITNAAAQHRRTWLDVENSALEKLNEERALILEQEEAERARKLEEESAAASKAKEERLKAEEESKRREEDERRRIREERLAKRNEEKAKLMEERELGLINDMIRDQEMKESTVDTDKSRESSGHEDEHDQSSSAEGEKSMDAKDEQRNVFNNDGKGCAGQEDNKEAIETSKDDTLESRAGILTTKKPATTKQTLTTLIQSDVERHTRLKSQAPFKLGQENLHKSYVNSYTTDPLALSKQQHQEERDRKRYTSHKFSLTTASEFKWMGNVNTTKQNAIATIRQTLVTLEACLPSTLLHINWTLIRKNWIIKVHTAKDKDLSSILMELVDNLRPCLFNTIWFDCAGHLRLVKVLASEREEKKKLEKFEKKWKDDEEERYRMAGLVKYTIPLKHQVFKQKGEEYRIHGQYGWQWVSGLRRGCFKPSKNIGLRAGPQRHVIQVKGEDGVVKTMLIDPNVYDKLMAKRVASECTGIQYDKVKLKNGSVVLWSEYLKMLDLGLDMEASNVKQEIEETDEAKDKLDEIIDLVENMEKSPEKAVLDDIVNQVVSSSSEIKEEQDTKQSSVTDPEIINVSKGLVLACRIQFPKIAAAAPVCDELLAKRTKLLLIEEATLKRKYGLRSYTCYCANCPSNCYSPTCINNIIVKERVYSSTDTTKPIRLKKNPSEITKKPDTPQISSKFRSKRGFSILILPVWELKKLGRSGGRSYVPAGFNSTKYWGNYPCGRPNFRIAWMYRTVTCGWSFASLGLQLRILWACIRWDDLHMKSPPEGKSQVTTDTEIITNEILNHRIAGRFNEKVQYLRRRHIVPIDVAPAMKTVVVKDQLEITPSRHGLRKRKRVSTPVETDPTVVEEWVDEEKLELWEIRYYGERKLNEKSTRLKSGVQLSKPDKYDPSSEAKTPSRRSAISNSSVENSPKEPEPIDTKVAHISKRDSHAKITNPVKPPEPTASELLQMQQTVAQKAFCSKSSANTFGGSVANSLVGRKFFMSKTQERMRQVAGEVLKTTIPGNSPRGPTPTTANTASTNATGTNPGIALSVASTRLPATPASVAVSRPPPPVPQMRVQIPAGATNRVASPVPQTINLTQAGQQSRLQVFKGEDGRLQIRGLLPGQHCYQTADGKIHIVGVGVGPNIGTTGQQSQSPRIIALQQRPTTPRLLVTQRTTVSPSPRIVNVRQRPAVGTQGVTQNIVVSHGQGQPAALQLPQTSTVATTQEQPVVAQSQLQQQQNSQGQTQATTGVSQPQPTIVAVVTSQQQPTVVGTRTPTGTLQPRAISVVQSATAGLQQRAPIPAVQGPRILGQANAQAQTSIGLQLSQGTSQVLNQLPISIVSPSKQPQQQTVQLIQGPDGKQYFARHPTTVVRRILQPSLGQTGASTTTTSSPVRLIMRGGTPGQQGQIRLIVRGGLASVAGQQQPILIRTSSGQLTPIRFVSPPSLVPVGAQPRAQPQSPTKIVFNETKPKVTEHYPNFDQKPEVLEKSPSPQRAPSPQNVPSPEKKQIHSPILSTQPPVIPGLSSPVKAEPTSPQKISRQKTIPTPTNPLGPAQLSHAAQSPTKIVFNETKPKVTEHSPNFDQKPEVLEKSPSPQRAPSPQNVPSPEKKQIHSPILSSQPAQLSHAVQSPMKIVFNETKPKLTEHSPNFDQKPEVLKKSPSPQRAPSPQNVPSPEKKQIHSPILSSQPPVIAGLSSPVKAEPTSPQKISRRKAIHTPTNPLGPAQLSHAARTLLFNHKEALKEDIMKKRALLEAQLNAEIQEEQRVKKRRSDESERNSYKDQSASFCASCAEAMTPLQFIVACTVCNKYFHGTCVDYTKEELNQGKVYTCDDCQTDTETDVIEEVVETTPAEPPKKKRRTAAVGRSAESEIYCLCKQPYDDSYFYISCDSCQDWFHGRCVGVLPIEGTTIEDYRCPGCAPDSPYNQANFKRLTQKDYANLRMFVKQILNLKEANAFYEPVDVRVHPNYRKIIREPMELRTMEQRIEQQIYTRLADFVSDACRMFDNCKHYNPATSKICKKGLKLEGFMVQKLRLIRQKMLS